MTPGSGKTRGAGKARASGQPAEATARKISVLLHLLRSRRIGVAFIQKQFGLSERQALRDLQELRKLGATLGFTITKRDSAGNVELADFANRPASLARGERGLTALVLELFKAFGEPLALYADSLVDSQLESPFVRVVMPRLEAGSAVATILNDLSAAWERGARVRFRYKNKEREVEPALAMVRSGRYYLVARELGAAGNGWRIYSMDEIRGPVRRCGSFAPKPPPAEYVSTDTIGWIKHEGKKQRVEVTVSPKLAPTATSRRWQAPQETTQHADGSATIAFSVGDVDEVIRWALGFGDEAWVSAPPAAVERAKAMVAQIAARYDRP